MTETPTPAAAELPPRQGALVFEPQEYLHFLAGCDWTEAQKHKFIEELWKIIVSFVDLGFDLHPIQKVIGRAQTLEAHQIGVLESRHTSSISNLQEAEPNHLVGAEETDS